MYDRLMIDPIVGIYALLFTTGHFVGIYALLLHEQEIA
jgi:hypothetical protein